jgi:dihydrofolate reductase
MKSILVAYDKNYGIGANNDLLWMRDLPADLAHFKSLTMDNAIIMGWNTYESIGRALPGRQNIVMSRSPRTAAEGVVLVDSLDSAYAAVEPGREAFIIGGGQVYKQALDTVDRIYATEVLASFDNATVFFPAIDKAVWRETERAHHEADERNKYPFDFVTYVRR